MTSFEKVYYTYVHKCMRQDILYHLCVRVYRFDTDTNPNYVYRSVNKQFVTVKCICPVYVYIKLRWYIHS